VKFDWQWPPAVLFSIVFVVIGALVYAGKVQASALLALLAWLAPGPYQLPKKGDSP
jgi:hypothetical protein